MGFLIIALFSITAPIFWFYGFICFLRNLFSKHPHTTESNTPLLKEIVTDLEKVVSNKAKPSDILEKYRNRVSVNSLEIKTSEIKPQPAEEGVVKPKPASASVLNQDLTKWWENWYQDNNINLLLYIGAFLIVSSAAIFVGFNWENFSGSFKALVLTLITLAFFLSGLFFYTQTPKLKNAGSTFIAIGALLIPFNGLAWYNFSLNQQGVDFGSVWLATSVISLVVYFSLAYVIKNPFYTYIAGFGGLSLIESFVNIGDLNSRFYILAGIFSAFALLAASRFAKEVKTEGSEILYSQPLNISSQVAMPVFLAWGLLLASANSQLFTIETSFSVLLAAIYYLVIHSLNKNVNILTIAQLLLTLALVLGLKTALIEPVFIYTSVFALAGLFQLLGYAYKKENDSLSSTYTIFVSVFISVLALIFSYASLGVTANQSIIFSLVLTLLSASASLLNRQANYLYLSVVGVNLAAYISADNWNILSTISPFSYLGIFYLTTGLVLYSVGLNFWKKSKNWAQPFLISSGVNFLMSFMLTLIEPSFGLITGIALAAVSFWSVKQFLQKDLGYLGIVLIIIATFQLLKLVESPSEFYPLAFSALSFVIWAVQFTPQDLVEKHVFKNSALVLAIFNPIVFAYSGLNSYSTYDRYYTNNVYNGSLLEKTSLLSAYFSTGLLALEAWISKKDFIAYIASGAAVITLIWQYNYLNVDETQVYTITIASYFLAWGFVKKLQQKLETQKTLDLVGLGILILPLFLQASPETGAWYALFLGFEGTVLLLAGLSLNHKTYTYAGAAAIALATFTRVYSFVSSLPSWAIVGLGGLLFLSTAIYLLNKRTLEHPND